MPEFPSREWAEEYCRALNGSEGYRRSARGWVWPILFKVRMPDGSVRGFVARLNNGRCEGVEWLDDASRGDAPYVISATLDDWLSIIRGEVSPIAAFTRGKLKLEKGSMAMVLRYPLAAMEMVKAAQRVEAKG